MQKETIEILLNTLALQVRESIPKDKVPSKLASEYDLSTSIMHDVLNGKRNISFTTFFMVIEILGIEPEIFVKNFCKKLPKNFTTLDL